MKAGRQILPVLVWVILSVGVPIQGQDVVTVRPIETRDRLPAFFPRDAWVSRLAATALYRHLALQLNLAHKLRRLSFGSIVMLLPDYRYFGFSWAR